MPLVRPASPADVAAIARIYGAAVRTSVATFDLTDPPNIYWEQKIASNECGDGYPAGGRSQVRSVGRYRLVPAAARAVATRPQVDCTASRRRSLPLMTK